MQLHDVPVFIVSISCFGIAMTTACHTFFYQSGLDPVYKIIHNRCPFQKNLEL